MDTARKWRVSTGDRDIVDGHLMPMGGQSIPNFDWAMADGVRKTYKKEFVNALADFYAINDDISFDAALEKAQNHINACDVPVCIDNAKEIIDGICDTFHFISWHNAQHIINRALNNTERATYQAMEALIHNLNTMHSRAGAQVPFSSLNYGTDTSTEGRMAIKNVLLATKAGLGNGETSIFPVQIFKVKEGVNYNEGDPNYDLFKLAMEVSAERLFPNFSFLDAPFNLQYYREGDYNSEVATMGCVAPESHVSYCIDNRRYESRFDKMYERVGKLYPLQRRGRTEYYDTSDGRVEIYDSHFGDYVKVKTVLRNSGTKNWKGVVFCDRVTKECLALSCTDDHPLPVKGKGRTLVRDLELGDECCHTSGASVYVDAVLDVDCGEYSYDVETETDYFDVNGIISHNCRTRVMGNTYDPERQVTCGRGNLSFTSINLPRLAIEAKKDLHAFYEGLDRMIDLVFRQLLHRFKIQSAKKKKNYPFLMGNGIWLDSDKLNPDDTVGEVLKHGTLTLGFIGLAETLVALIGEHHGQSDRAQELGLAIVGHMREACDRKSSETGLNFSLIGTPAEGLAGRFVPLDRERYGEIKGVTDKIYYTNSFHIPVYFPISAHRKIELEAPYHALTNGGHITYVELDGDTAKNLEAFESIIRYMHDKGVGYGSINHPVDRDPVCGYTGIINDVCPRCGRHEGEGLTPEQMQELARRFPNVNMLRRYGKD